MNLSTQVALEELLRSLTRLSNAYLKRVNDENYRRGIR